MIEGLVVVTDRGLAGSVGHRVEDVVAAAIEAGARTALLREKDMGPVERGRLAAALVTRLATVGGSLVVAGDRALAQSVGAAGVHLAAGDRAFCEPERLEGHPSGSQNDLVVGRSCHSIAELRAAAGERVDYATFSPVWVTQSKPGYGPVVGVEGLREACATVPDLPVVALGGIGPGRVAACRAAGAAGVAVMGAIMTADDPGQVVRRMLEEWMPETASGTRGPFCERERLTSNHLGSQNERGPRREAW